MDSKIHSGCALGASKATERPESSFMKRHGDLWDKITHPDNLLQAYKKARRGKGWRVSVKKFEEDIGGNLIQLREMLLAKQYTTSSYAEKIIYEPKKRTIYKLPFYPDRIVQHALLQVVIPIWDNLMIYDSYACRVGKGMHEASRKTMDHVRHFKYCLQADISKFYPSINHDILLAIISRKIKCKDTLHLLEDIIRSFPGGKNTPIGNYTSQWFGNLYMNEVDQLVKHTHHVSAYLRYCDDFVLFSDDKQMLHRLKDDIENFIGDKLQMKFSRWAIFPVTQGVDFLGYRHFPNKVLLRKSTAKRVIRRMELLPELLSSGKVTIDQYRSSIASTEGWLKWANTYNLILKLQLNTLKEVFQ